MSNTDHIDTLDAAKWRALVALSEGVRIVQAANATGTPDHVASGLADWLDALEADYRAAADAHSAALAGN